MCPRLGDIYALQERADDVAMEVVIYRLEKVVTKELDHIDLEHCRLNELAPDLFTAPQLQNVQSLSLSRNELFSLERVLDAIMPLTGGLTHLNLSFNQLNGFVPASIGSFQSLTTLHLDNNYLFSISEDIGALTSLEVLTLSNNQLSSLPESLGSLQQLKKLSLRSNRLTTLDPSILVALGPSLEILILSSNKLEELPEEMGEMSRLVKLDVSSNKLTELPESLQQCSRLEFLSFSDNQIREISGDIMLSLENLTFLAGFKNKLEAVPPEIGVLSNLTSLSLSNNNLRTLPEEMGECSSLQHLSLSGNPKFSSLPSSAEQWLRLRTLNMQKCQGFKQLPAFVEEWPEIQEVDVRAAKKQVCKISPDTEEVLQERGCLIRGGVVKGKKKKK